MPTGKTGEVWTVATHTETLVGGAYDATAQANVEAAIKAFLDDGWSILDITTIVVSGTTLTVVVTAAIRADGTRANPT